MELCPNTHNCEVQATTLLQFQAAVAQLDAYTASGRLPELQNRIDDVANLRINFSFVEMLDLG